MFNINKVISVPVNPHSKESVDLILLELCEEYAKTVIRFKDKEEKRKFKFSHLDKKELSSTPGRRRFMIKAAYGNKDK